MQTGLAEGGWYEEQARDSLPRTSVAPAAFDCTTGWVPHEGAPFTATSGGRCDDLKKVEIIAREMARTLRQDPGLRRG
jgi:hypothetical protein